jgi:hypothetical protein
MKMNYSIRNANFNERDVKKTRKKETNNKENKFEGEQNPEFIINRFLFS